MSNNLERILPEANYSPFEDETDQLLGAEYEDEESEGEELINDSMERDYRKIPKLEAACMEEDLDLVEISEALGSQQDFETVENLEDMKGMSVVMWIQQPATKLEIRNRFFSFLRTFFNDEGKSVYVERIGIMAQAKRKSLIINYEHLVAAEPYLAYFLPEAPKGMLEIFDEVAFAVTLSRYPNYKNITESIHVRISHLLLVDEIRSLQQIHIDKLIRTSGVVSSCTPVLPQLNLVQFNCIRCDYTIRIFTQTDSTNEIKPSTCPYCLFNGTFEINFEKTLYKNYQRITVQESPGTVPACGLPRSKDVILLDDLVDSCKPGDEIVYFEHSAENWNN